MRNSGQLLVIAGIALAVYALFFMDVSVPVGNGARVNNIGLMAQQQNYILIAIALFAVGVLLSFVRRKRINSDIDFSKINELTSNDFFILKDEIVSLDVYAIDKLSLMLLKKHGNASVNDILLMNLPLIDKLSVGIPDSIRKNFKPALIDRLKENS